MHSAAQPAWPCDLPYPHPSTVLAPAAQAPPRALAFHIGDTTLSFPLRPEEAARLGEALTGVMQTFAEKQKADRPKRWPALEYVFKGEGGSVEGGLPAWCRHVRLLNTDVVAWPCTFALKYELEQGSAWRLCQHIHVIPDVLEIPGPIPLPPRHAHCPHSCT